MNLFKINQVKILTAFFASTLFICCSTTSCQKEEETIIVDKKPKVDEEYFPKNVRPVLDDLHKRTVMYCWDTQYGAAELNSGMLGEGADRKDQLATGGTGFGVMAIVSGVSRGWIDRAEAALRLQKLVRFLGGDADRYKGAWSHWMKTNGEAIPWGSHSKKGGDLLETSLMLQGLIVAREYFNANDPIEQEIRDSVNSFYNSVKFNQFTNNQNKLYWSWYPDGDFYELPVRGWNEGFIEYMLALSSKDYSIPYSTYYNGWYGNGGIVRNVDNYGYKTTVDDPFHMPMFLSQYSMLSFNPKLMQDKHMDYWQHVVNHTMINRHYCAYADGLANNYSEDIWGLTASYGENSYSAHSPTNDKGIIAPTAALTSMPFTPFYSTQFMMHIKKEYQSFYGRFGFYDAFSPKTDWKSNSYLSIDQAPIAIMIENYRSGLIWELFMNSPEAKNALSIANITKPNYQNGFPQCIPDVKDNVFDVVMHPDKEKYSIDFYIDNNYKVKFELLNLDSNKIDKVFEDSNYQKGTNSLTFNWDEELMTNINYSLKMIINNEVKSELIIQLH